MDFNEKSILKKLNDIEMDISSFENENIQMDEIQQKNLKNTILKNINNISSKRNKKIKYASVAAALTAILFTGSMFMINPAIADEIPVLNSIIKSNFDSNTNYEDYIHSIGKSITCKGVTVTLKEVVSDDNTIMIGYIIKSEKPIKELFPDELLLMPGEGEIKINNKLSGGCGKFQFTHIDDHTLSLYESTDFSRITLPSKYKLDINWVNVGNIKGDWSFNIAMNHEDTKKVSKTFDINKNIQLSTGDLFIKTITASPISFKIDFNRLNKNDNNFPEWNIVTDKGEQLVGNGTFLSSEGDGFGEHDFTPAKKIPSKIRIINILSNSNKKSTIETKEMSNLPVVFKSENLGALTINKVEKLEDKMLVYIHSDSLLPITLAQQLKVVDKDNPNPNSNFFYCNYDNIKYDKTYKDLIIEYKGYKDNPYSINGNYEFSFDNGAYLSIDPNFNFELDLKNGH